MPKKDINKNSKKEKEKIEEADKTEELIISNNNLNIFNLTSIGQSLSNEEELLNKLQIEISEYTNYDNIQNPYNFK